MPRMKSCLSRPVLTLMPVSLAATMAAAAIWSAVPHRSEVPAPPPVLTSGGKFAARALDAVANDGLDVMPLPRIAGAATLPALMAAPFPESHRVAWEAAATPLPALDHPARAARPTLGAARVDVHRVAAGEPNQRTVALPSSPAPTAASDTGGDGVLAQAVSGILPAIAAAARGTWAETASAGEALMSRVTSRVP